MESAGFKIKLINSPGEEIFPDDLSTKEIPEYLAVQKALNALPNASDLETIVAADTIVSLDDKMIGKPTSREHCVNTIRSLMDKSHQVYTGVCILKPPLKKVFTVTSTVKINSLSDEEIDYYIEHYNPFDKAGSYGIQEWFGICKVNYIEGSYTNIMGLPMHELYEALKSMYSH